MRTVDTSVEHNENWWTKLRRDLALALQLFLMTTYYWSVGRKIRAAYRRCEEHGEMFYVDDDPAEPERRLR